MTEAELFILSEEAFRSIVEQIKDEQWELKVPPSIHIGEKEMTLRELINYHAYDTAWVPDTLAGKTIAEVGTAYDGDLLKDDPKGNYRRFSEKAIAAAKNVSDPDKKVHLSYGDYPAKDYLWHIATFRTFRKVDLAGFLGLDDSLPEKLVTGMYTILVPQAEMLRSIGLFGPKVEVPENATTYMKLLGLSGRHPGKQ